MKYLKGVSIGLGLLGLVIIGVGLILILFEPKSFILYTVLYPEDSGNSIIPFIATGAALLTFAAFLIQVKANESIRDQFKVQKVNDHFYKMLDIHIKNVSEMSMTSYFSDSYTGFKIEIEYEKVKSTNFSGSEMTKALDDWLNANIIKNRDGLIDITKIKKNKNDSKIVGYHDGDPIIDRLEITSRRCFLLMLKDFNLTFHLVTKINETSLNNGLTNEQVKSIAYQIFFWGTESNNLYSLDISHHILDYIISILDKLREKFRKNKGAKYRFKFDIELDEYQKKEKKKQIFTKSNSIRFIPFSGHSSRLAHYYRHLYQTVVFLHKSYVNKFINKDELTNHLKTLRAQLSNEEQLLLYYNYICEFGGNWNGGTKGYQFLTEYKMIHNIPLYGNVIKGIDHPNDHFRKFVNKKKKIDSNYELFEWNENKTKSQMKGNNKSESDTDTEVNQVKIHSLLDTLKMYKRRTAIQSWLIYLVPLFYVFVQLGTVQAIDLGFLSLNDNIFFDIVIPFFYVGLCAVYAISFQLKDDVISKLKEELGDNLDDKWVEHLQSMSVIGKMINQFDKNKWMAIFYQVLIIAVAIILPLLFTCYGFFPLVDSMLSDFHWLLLILLLIYAMGFIGNLYLWFHSFKDDVVDMIKEN